MPAEGSTAAHCTDVTSVLFGLVNYAPYEKLQGTTKASMHSGARMPALCADKQHQHRLAQCSDYMLASW